MHSDGSVWVSNNESQDVWVLDPQALTTRRAGAGLGGLGMFGDFNADGRVFYVPSQGREDRVTAIDTQSLAVLGSTTLPRDACLNAHEVLHLSSGLVLVCEGDHLSRNGTLVFLSDDPQQPAVRGHLETGLFPDAVQLVPPAPR